MSIFNLFHSKPRPAELAAEAVIEATKQKTTTADVNDPNLFCYGCAHSAGCEAFPSRPSGERPCWFCVRNKEREKPDAPHIREWYDGSPIAFYPMDAYQPIDMIEQAERWRRKDQGDPCWNQPRGGIRLG